MTKAKAMFAVFVCNMTFHPEVLRWLEEFFDELLKNDREHTKLVCHVVLLGVDVASEHGRHWERESGCCLDEWFLCRHRQRAFNSVIYAMIVHFRRLYTCRKVLRRDMGRPDQFIGACPESFGEIVTKKYGHALLENFFLAEPHPDWVDMEIVENILDNLNPFKNPLKSEGAHISD